MSRREAANCCNRPPEATVAIAQDAVFQQADPAPAYGYLFPWIRRKNHTPTDQSAAPEDFDTEFGHPLPRPACDRI